MAVCVRHTRTHKKRGISVIKHSNAYPPQVSTQSLNVCCFPLLQYVKKIWYFLTFLYLCFCLCIYCNKNPVSVLYIFVVPSLQLLQSKTHTWTEFIGCHCSLNIHDVLFNYLFWRRHTRRGDAHVNCSLRPWDVQLHNLGVLLELHRSLWCLKKVFYSYKPTESLWGSFQSSLGFHVQEKEKEVERNWGK